MYNDNVDLYHSHEVQLVAGCSDVKCLFESWYNVITGQLQLWECVASNGWLVSFKAHHGLSTRQGTSFGQKLAKDGNQKLDSIIAFILSALHSHNYQLSDTYNMDETPRKFDMPGNRTLHSAGKKTIMIHTNEAEKCGFMAVLTVAVDGWKLQSVLIFKGVRDPKVNIRGGRVTIQWKGYISEMGKHAFVFITLVVLFVLVLPKE